MLHSSQPPVAGPPGPAGAASSGITLTPDYLNAGGQGDRTATIAVSASTGLVHSGVPSNLVNGNTTADTTNSLRLNAIAVAGHWIEFDFGAGAAKVITEATWAQAVTNAQGTWKWQGSKDRVTYTDIGASFTLGGSTSQVMATLSGNGTGYRFYRLLGVSGSAVTIYNQEITFKIGATIADYAQGSVFLPMQASTDQSDRPATTAGAALRSILLSGWASLGDDGDRARRDDVAHTLDYYADSVGGTAGGDGLGRTTAKNTIANLLALSPGATSRLGLVSGSSWKESLYPPSGASRVIGVGDEALPILDGADIVSAGSFAVSTDPANTAGKLFMVTLTRDAAGVYTGTDSYMLWETDPSVTDPANAAYGMRQLARAASAAAAHATPGSVWFNPNVGTSTAAHVHPFGDTDPRSDGKLYEATKRAAGLQFQNTNKMVIEGVHTTRFMGAYGGLSAGRDVVARRCLMSKGGKHNGIIKSGTWEDCIGFDHDVTSVDGAILFTAYEADPSKNTVAVRRCMAIMPAGRTSPSTQAIYCHGSPNGFARVLVDGFVSLRSGGAQFDAAEQRINDLAVLDGALNAFIVQGTSAQKATLKRFLARMTAANNTLYLPSAFSTANIHTVEMCDGAVYVKPGGGTSGSVLSPAIAQVLNFHHNVIRMDSGGAFASQAASVTMPAGSAFKNNILINGQVQTGSPLTMTNVVPSFTSDYNVYVNLTGAQLRWFNAVTATQYNSLAAYQAATGQDANSIVLDAGQAKQLFLGDTSAGDFRLNTACPIKFADGTPVVGNAGPRSFRDWNGRGVLPGQPFAWPTPPNTLTEAEAYCRNPRAWNWYP